MTTTASTLEATEQRAARTLTRADYERYLPLVRRTAMRLARRVPKHISVADLVSCGWLGLIEAFRRTDGSMNDERFEAYAVYRVRGAMLDHLRHTDEATRDERRASRDIAHAIRELTNELGRAPEEDEIATRLGLSADAYHATLARVARAGMARLELLDLDRLETDTADEAADDALGRKQMQEAVVGAIQRLPQRLQQILALYYQEECTLKEIGAILGVTESRVSQLHTEAVHRLRAAIGRE